MDKKTYNISFTDKVKLEKNDYIQIYYGHGYFSYVRCNADGFKRMHEDYLNQVPSRPSDYGEVIYTDFIKAPDDKAKAFLDNWLKENS